MGPTVDARGLTVSDVTAFTFSYFLVQVLMAGLGYSQHMRGSLGRAVDRRRLCLRRPESGVDVFRMIRAISHIKHRDHTSYKQ